jgi:hypothetical protein
MKNNLNDGRTYERSHRRIISREDCIGHLGIYCSVKVTRLLIPLIEKYIRNLKFMKIPFEAKGPFHLQRPI